jgi:YidC/Oxa1 family membrane protein insertase
MFNTLLVQPLFNILAVIYAYLPGHDLGIAIIIFTILVRLALWPLVNKQLHSQRALQELQPEIARIRSEAKGDKTLEGKLTMELYKEKEINPFASFLPLLIQLPIFLALFVVFKDIVNPDEIAKLAYPWVAQLPSIQSVISSGEPINTTFLGFINLANPSWLLAAVAGVLQFIQTKQLLPKHNASDSAAQVTKGMTYIFPFVTFFVGLSLPGALALYWGAGSAMAILQQTLILRKDVEEIEAVVLPSNINTSNKPKKKKRHKGGSK